VLKGLDFGIGLSLEGPGLGLGLQGGGLDLGLKILTLTTLLKYSFLTQFK